MTAEIIPFPTLDRSGSGAFGGIEEIWPETMPANACDPLDLADALQGDFGPLVDGLRCDPELPRQFHAIASSDNDGPDDGVSIFRQLSHVSDCKPRFASIASTAASQLTFISLTYRDMEKTLGETLREGRKATGLTLAKAAEKFGVSHAAVQQWESGVTRPSTENLLKAMKLYGIDVVGPPSSPPPQEQSARMQELPEGLPSVPGRRDLPVKGIAIGGGDGEGDFRFNGETVDYLPRPPMLAHRRRAFAVQVSNDSMYPRFSEGMRLYVDPDQHARPGDDVIIELHPPRDGEAGAAYVKTLVKRTPTRIVVEQFNPPKEIPFELAQVRSVYRVIPWPELLGI